MPKAFLENNAPGFLKVYDEYYKQVQYKMTAFEKCEDPNNVDPFGFEVLYPTDTYYPKGTMCAKPFFLSHLAFILVILGPP